MRLDVPRRSVEEGGYLPFLSEFCFAFHLDFFVCVAFCAALGEVIDDPHE